MSGIVAVAEFPATVGLDDLRIPPRQIRVTHLDLFLRARRAVEVDRDQVGARISRYTLDRHWRTAQTLVHINAQHTGEQDSIDFLSVRRRIISVGDVEMPILRVKKQAAAVMPY